MGQCNKWRSFLVYVFILAMVFSFTGCNSKDVKIDPKQPVSLTIWHYYNGPQKIAFDDAVRKFNETVGYEKGIIVEAVSKNSVNQLAEDVIASAKGESGMLETPDIFACYGDSAFEIYKMGKLVALDQYMTKAQMDEYAEPFIQEGRLNTEELYVFPTAKSTESIFLNKTDFDRFAKAVSAPPYNQDVSYEDLKTWEGIKRVGILYNHYTDNLTPNILYDGKAFFGVDSYANFLTVAAKQLSGEIATVENEKLVPGMNEEIMRRMFDLYYGGTVEGAFIRIGTYASDDVKTGDTLAMLASTTGARYFPSSVTQTDGTQHEIELAVLPMPVMEGGIPYAVSQGAGMAVFKSDTEGEYAAVQFLLWFTEVEENIAFSLESGYLPVKKAALQSETITKALSSMTVDQSLRGTVAALEMGIEQMQTYALCYGSIFDGSIEYRKILEDSLKTVSTEARADLLAKAKAGESYSKLVKQVYSGDPFHQWLNELERKIAEAAAK